MTDSVGFRATWGVIIPSTNTVVEHDFALLCPPGVTSHSGRSFIRNPAMDNDDRARALLDQMDESFGDALADVLTVKPDRIVITMSAEVIRRGVKGGAAFVDAVAQRAGVPVSTGPEACVAALRALGVERIALVSPYHPESEKLTVDYFSELGFDVRRTQGLRCTSATAIAATTDRQLIDALRAVDGPDVEALLQVGTNLPMVRIAAEAERWMDKPTIAMNTATVWHALRQSDIPDRIYGFGSLLSDY